MLAAASAVGIGQMAETVSAESTVLRSCCVPMCTAPDQTSIDA
jgi:hypothetical protein